MAFGGNQLSYKIDINGYALEATRSNNIAKMKDSENNLKLIKNSASFSKSFNTSTTQSVKIGIQYDSLGIEQIELDTYSLLVSYNNFIGEDLKTELGIANRYANRFKKLGDIEFFGSLSLNISNLFEIGIQGSKNSEYKQIGLGFGFDF